VIDSIHRGVPAGLEEIAQLRRTLWRRRHDILAFNDHDASNGPTEAINGRLEALGRNVDSIPPTKLGQDPRNSDKTCQLPFDVVPGRSQRMNRTGAADQTGWRRVRIFFTAIKDLPAFPRLGVVGRR
jgi:hypothetical protein